MKLTTTKFGEKAQLYTIENHRGTVLELSDFGARIVNLSMKVDQQQRDLVLGFDSAEEYEAKDSYIGATIGRVAGRLSGGSYQLAQQMYQLPQNDGLNCLHGGPKSVDCQIWQTSIEQREDRVTIHFRLVSRDGENGFPGNLDMTVSHTLTNEDEWHIEYQAETDAPTLFNPTNHVYFNLNQHRTEEIGSHLLSIDADVYGVLTENLIPTGELRAVQGTPFDFRGKAVAIDQGLKSDDLQNRLVDGYDHPFLLNENGIGPQVVLMDSQQLVKVEMMTDAPAVVVYTSNMVDEPVVMKDSFQVKHGGVTLETQQLPDAINHDNFGSIVLKPDHIFRSKTVFNLSVNN